MIHAFLLALAISGAAPATPTIEVGRGDWTALPRLSGPFANYPTAAMVDRVEQILRHSRCDLPGQSPDRFDITVPFAVLMRADGNAERIVVAEVGCEPLETYVGSIVRLLARRGDLQFVPAEEPRWYSNEISFTLR